MKKLKVVLISLFVLTILSSICFAVSFEPIQTFETTENNKSYITKVYEVDEANDSLFKAGLIKEFRDGNSKYELESIETKGGNLTLTKAETQIKVIETNTDDKNEILNQLQPSIQYGENDGYTGELKLDMDSIVTTKISSGSYKKSYTVRDDFKFSGYSANDLYDIPKFKYKNGVNMKLLNVDWKVQSSEYVAGSQVPVLYSGVAHYAGTGYKTVESEAKYSTSAEYKGEIVKEEINPITYYVRYIETDNKTLAIVLCAALCVLALSAFIYFLFNKNVEIYNLQGEQFVLIDKRNINYSNPVVNLNNLSEKSMSNIYRIVFSKRLTNKISGMKVKVVQDNKTSQYLVNAYNQEYTIDVTM